MQRTDFAKQKFDVKFSNTAHNSDGMNIGQRLMFFTTDLLIHSEC